MSNNKFELFFIDQDYWDQISSVWYHLMPNKKTENFSRPYFGPLKIELYENVEFYIPFSTKWYQHENDIPILDNEGKYIVKKNTINSIFVVNKNNEYRAIINFQNMIIVPKNSNFITKIDITNSLLTVQEKFVNDEKNLEEIQNKFKTQIRMYLNSSDYNINTKFKELLEWANNYNLLPFPKNPRGCPTREQFIRGQKGPQIAVIILMIAIIIILAIVLPLVLN